MRPKGPQPKLMESKIALTTSKCPVIARRKAQHKQALQANLSNPKLTSAVEFYI